MGARKASRVGVSAPHACVCASADALADLVKKKEGVRKEVGKLREEVEAYTARGKGPWRRTACAAGGGADAGAAALADANAALWESLGEVSCRVTDVQTSVDNLR